MKHIDLTKPNSKGLAKYMVTQESNNFGDQILTLKVYESKMEEVQGHGMCKVSGYSILAITSRGEGDWMDIKQMKSWLKNVKAIGLKGKE